MIPCCPQCNVPLFRINLSLFTQALWVAELGRWHARVPCDESIRIATCPYCYWGLHLPYRIIPGYYERFIELYQSSADLMEALL